MEFFSDVALSIYSCLAAPRSLPRLAHGGHLIGHRDQAFPMGLVFPDIQGSVPITEVGAFQFPAFIRTQAAEINQPV